MKTGIVVDGLEVRVREGEGVACVVRSGRTVGRW